ncbi:MULTISPECIES: cytochrome P450 [unclassified Streptomyces]|uniref:cytochrome P450 n=1 Tax=unclassified Streptomyces TaxID=2593676 RepID=UPI001BE742E2|nr:MULTISPECIES: cytochrome P450 [unclassified Streptomyces]MBT2405498.1 cytochrome P450 [Streptomyces sp. ISL-21]MBT2607823.1 cytochrome P450 [Streptomyces sp. ISL-87]
MTVTQETAPAVAEPAVPGPVVPEPAALDLTDPQTFLDVDLHAMWRRFRTESPVHWHPAGPRTPGFWVVSTYADAVAVYRDNKRFTSETGNVLTTLLQGEDSASRKMLAVTDGVRHREIRNLMLKSFAPRVLEPVVDGVHAHTRELLGRAIAAADVDFVGDVVDHIPIHTMGDLLDIPLADRPRLVEWNTQTLARHGSGDDEFESLMARNEIIMYMAGLAAERRRSPGEDVLSTLAAATVDGRPLTEDEIVLNAYSLILGGDESTRSSLIGGLVALAGHPEQWRRLKAGEVSVDTATEEILRWTTPAMHFGRRALVDVPLRDKVIKAGDVVTLWNTSANFDEDAFADPESFDVGRTPNKHVVFGHGPHFCLGAFLGRVHVKAMVEALRDMVSDITLLGPPQHLYSNFVRGYSALPVAFTPADQTGKETH